MTIISESETIIINKDKYKCDVCEKIEGSRMCECYGCGIHVCNKCRVWLDCHPITGLAGGDHGWALCKQCNEKSIKHYAKYRKAMDEIDKLEDSLISDWRKECENRLLSGEKSQETIPPST